MPASIGVVEEVPSKFTVHCFSSEIDARIYFYDILRMKDSLMIIITEKSNRQLDNMSLAVTRHNVATATQLFGGLLNNISTIMSKHLANKLQKNVFVSVNCPEDRTLHFKIERQLLEEIKKNPQYF